MSLKDIIVDESLKLFSVKGFMNTSITDILEAAGTSKGGFYNHFKSKDELFFAALSRARKLWREKNLEGDDPSLPPMLRLKNILTNYRDRYLVDQHTCPGGCIFVNLSSELNDQAPGLAAEINEGFGRLKSMFKRLLGEEKDAGNLREAVNIDRVTELIFSSLLGACVMYTSDKSKENLNNTMASLMDYLSHIYKEPLS